MALKNKTNNISMEISNVVKSLDFFISAPNPIKDEEKESQLSTEENSFFEQELLPVDEFDTKNLESDVLPEGMSVFEGLERLPRVEHDTRIKWSGYLSTYFKVQHRHTFQEHAINALVNGIDVIVVQSTSSGKSLVSQLPAVMAFGKVSVCLCTTLSLMVDQVINLTEKGIKAVKLESDHTLHDCKQCI